MSDRPTRDLSASVRARLAAVARASGVDFQSVLTRYVTERFLRRLGESEHKRRFYLKGAALFYLSGLPVRPTRDVDLLGHGSAKPADVLDAIRTICEYPDQDGLAFRTATARASVIREGERYEGVRVQVDAELARAVVHLQIDVGFGDAVTPGPREVIFPTILELSAPVILAYPLETVVAEKFEAMVKLGLLNSRLKDFYDLHELARTTTFSQDVLSSAIRATFERRGTPVPDQLPVALTAEFGENIDKVKQWSAFCKKNRLAAPDLMMAIEVVRSLVWPAVLALHLLEERQMIWTPGLGWNER